MLNMDSNIHILCTKGNESIEIWEELSTVTAAIKSPQLKSNATYDEKAKPTCKPFFFCKSIPGKVRLCISIIKPGVCP